MKKVLFCSGKVYYDIKKARADKGLDDKIALVRVEQVWTFFKIGIVFYNNQYRHEVFYICHLNFQISPFPYDLIKKECAKYPDAQLVWAQEEHKNQGAWFYVQNRFNTTLNGGRPVS